MLPDRLVDALLALISALLLLIAACTPIDDGGGGGPTTTNPSSTTTTWIPTTTTQVPTTTTTEPQNVWCPDDGAQAVVMVEVVLTCDATLGSLTVMAEGSVTFDGDRELTVDGTQGTGRVEVFGSLRMRPSEQESHTLTFTGLDESAMIGGDAGMMTDPGGLHVMGPGVLDLDGPDRTAWTRLTGPHNQDASIIQVVAADGWKVGDELVITPTIPGDHLAYSAARIDAIDGTTVTLGTPLTFDHPATGSIGAEVLNLTRNVVIRTAEGSGRSYVTVHPSAGAQQIADVALVELGPTSVIGRYPLHLHKQGEGARGSTFDRLVSVGSNNRAFVPHASHGTTWTDVVAHDTRLTPFWWDTDDGGRIPNDENASDDTVWLRAVASDVEAGGRDDRGERFRVAGFALNRGVGNELVDSVAVGVNGPTDASGYHWTEGETGRGSGVWLFEGNLARNNARHGIFTWQNTAELHVISDFTAIGNGAWGVSHGAYRNPYVYERLDLIENQAGGVLIHANGREDGLYLNDVRVAGSPVGIQTTRHQQAPLTPTFIADPVFTDVGLPLVGNGSNQPDDVVVTGSGLGCPEWGEEAHPDSVWTVDGERCTP